MSAILRTFLRRNALIVNTHIMAGEFRSLNLAVVLCFATGLIAPWWAPWFASFVAGSILSKNLRSVNVWRHFFFGFLGLSIIWIVGLDLPNGMRITYRLGPMFHLPWGLLILVAPLPLALGSASLATLASMLKVISQGFKSPSNKPLNK